MIFNKKDKNDASVFSDIKIKSATLKLNPDMPLPVIPSKEIIPVPGVIIPISSGNASMTRLLEDAHITESEIILLGKKEQKMSDLSSESFFKIGSVGRVVQILKLPGMGVKAIVQPVKRVMVRDFIVTNETLYAKVENLHIIVEDSHYVETSFRIIKNLYSEYQDVTGSSSDAGKTDAEEMDILQSLDMIIYNLDINYRKKQELLEITDIRRLLSELHALIINEIEFARLEKKIEAEVSKKAMEEQRDYFLREKLKGLQSEIAGKDSEIEEVVKIKELIAKGLLTDVAVKKAENEMAKLKRLHSMSPEYGLVRDYLDLMASLPWKKGTQKDIDLKSAETILEEDHYGLKKPKERILEYLSVLKLAGKIKGPILCLVGPPGVGKTSLGKSIARALGREYIRIALGGLHDEAEIRGHRRTYIGAMPGKIIHNLKKAGVNNPLVLLDEIDKLSKDYRGDPAAALLEVLDPEQNNTFMDNYLDVEFDLSNILFVTTANSKSTIPPALLDRMEVIEIDGYLDTDKYHIATDFLIKKQTTENGIPSEKLEITDESVYKIISDYTREAGVRELDRKISRICRKAAFAIVSDDIEKMVVTPDMLEEMLGIPTFSEYSDTEGDKVGCVNGLAWTQAGGSVLKVECNIMEGKPKLSLTGKLGDVMKESATAALSYIRANASKYDINPEIFDKNEIHIHFPEGAVPKDGPSAGITITIALLSLLKNIPVSQKIGMTGEITIKGDVLPIGGLNAKLMAAKRVKIDKVIIPEKNKINLKEIDNEITDSFEVITASHIDNVIKVCIPSFMT